MTNEILIYAIREGESRPFMEEILSTQCKTKEEITRVVTEAKQAGWHSFRLATYDGTAPDFTKTINV